METIQKLKPDVVITFPFLGFCCFKIATKLRITLKKKAILNKKLFCSVRDVIESSKGGNNDPDTVNILNKLYDHYLFTMKKLILMSSSFIYRKSKRQ
jgi:predicted glycosyltransferase